MNMKPIYLDYAAATPVDPRVVREMLPYFTKFYANPGSAHDAGRKAREAIENSRKKIAEILHCLPEEIIFASGGTESINLAIKGIAFQKGKGHIITSKIEHPSVLDPCRYLEKKGFKVSYAGVDSSGLVDSHEIKQLITKKTILITIHYANSEIGTIQPIAEIGTLARKHNIHFHTDACQAGNLDLNVENLNVDLLSLNGSKTYGPKGIGILYTKKNIRLEPLLHGGGQEFAFRSGTENVPGIVGFAKALELIQKGREKENKKERMLRDYFIREILQNIPGSMLNGHPARRIPGNINISFAGIEAEALVQHLSQKGIYISAGSACSAGKIEVSHVLTAIKAEHPRGSVRFSLGRETTRKELAEVVGALQKVVGWLRKTAA